MGKYDVEKTVERYVKENHMIVPGEGILLGMSGGADSTCLFFLLLKLSKKWDCPLQVLHVNHMVRSDASEDARFVEHLCTEAGVPFHLECVDMEGYAKERGLSDEEAGRILRYDLFEDYRKKLGLAKIAVAHNSNDRAETMLFHLFRGTGLKGLASIQSMRGKIIRPLLCLERTQIEAYLEAIGVTYRTDSTNASDAYARNRIRNHIIPYVQEALCPQVVTRMHETAKQLTQIEDYLERQTMKAYANCMLTKGDQKGVCLTQFLEEEPVLQRRILLRCLEDLTPYRKDITSAHIEQILRFIRRAGSASMQLPYGIIVRKEYSVLLFEKVHLEQDFKHEEQEVFSKEDENQSEGELCIEGFGTLSFTVFTEPEAVERIRQNIPGNKYTKCFDYDKITTSVQLRTRRTGDYLFCDAMLHKKSIKEYMINEKIPKQKRDTLWLLADGNHVLWIPGFRISEGCKVDERTRRVVEIRIQEEEHGRTS